MHNASNFRQRKLKEYFLYQKMLFLTTTKMLKTIYHVACTIFCKLQLHNNYLPHSLVIQHHHRRMSTNSIYSPYRLCFRQFSSSMHCIWPCLYKINKFSKWNQCTANTKKAKRREYNENHSTFDEWMRWCLCASLFTIFDAAKSN